MVAHPLYNQVQYNTHTYNFSTFWHIKNLVETVSNADTFAKAVEKIPFEILAIYDPDPPVVTYVQYNVSQYNTQQYNGNQTVYPTTIVKDVSKVPQETQFMIDIVTKILTRILPEQVLTEELQIQNWLKIEKNKDISDFSN